MTRYTSSRPCSWIEPRQPLHASDRLYRHGPVEPMEQPDSRLRYIVSRGLVVVVPIVAVIAVNWWAQ